MNKVELDKIARSTAAGWLAHLIDLKGGGLSPHFQEEIDYNGLSEEEALYCQKRVERIIRKLMPESELDSMDVDFKEWYRN